VQVSASGYFQELWGGGDSDDNQRRVMTALARAQEGLLKRMNWMTR
jgi:hypothetical protein